MRIVVISGSYPNHFQPARGVFVHNLVEVWRRQGHQVIVIAPVLLGKKFLRALTSRGATAQRDGGQVMRPRTLSFSNIRLWGSLTTAHITQYFFKRAVRQCLKKLPWTPDLMYAHFLFPAGAACTELSKEFGVPHLVALGEDSLADYYLAYGREYVFSTVGNLQGVISVSKENQKFCLEEWKMDADKIAVLPNSVNPKQFYPRNKREMRQKYGFDEQRLLIGFVGYFIERKGPLRVMEAIASLPEVGAVFVGEGPQTPQGNQIVFCDAVVSEGVPELLSTLDIFVLPTQSEGSCNAVSEAMACGLPIVASDIAAVREQVNDQNALLVPWDDIQGLTDSLATLVVDPNKRRAMGQVSLNLARNFTLEHRAQAITEFARKLNTL